MPFQDFCIHGRLWQKPEQVVIREIGVPELSGACPNASFKPAETRLHDILRRARGRYSKGYKKEGLGKVEELQKELWLTFMPALKSTFETSDGNTWTVMDGEYTKYLGYLINRKISKRPEKSYLVPKADYVVHIFVQQWALLHVRLEGDAKACNVIMRCCQ